MALNYERIGWENAPSTNTPIDAGSLNHMDNGILAVSNQYDVDVPYLQQQVAGIPAMLDSYLAEEIGTDVTAWLNAHVTPGGSTIVVDDTLTISGAAADAAKCGELKNAFNDVLTTSRNIWDEKWDNGYISTSDGQTHPMSGYIVTKNYISCKGNTDYYIYKRSTYLAKIFVFFYDESHVFLDYIESSSSTSFTTPDDAVYIKFYTRADAYTGGICVNISDLFNGIYSPFELLDASRISALNNSNIVVYAENYPLIYNDANQVYHNTHILNELIASFTDGGTIIFPADKKIYIGTIIVANHDISIIGGYFNGTFHLGDGSATSDSTTYNISFKNVRIDNGNTKDAIEIDGVADLTIIGCNITGLTAIKTTLGSAQSQVFRRGSISNCKLTGKANAIRLYNDNHYSCGDILIDSCQLWIDPDRNRGTHQYNADNCYVIEAQRPDGINISNSVCWLGGIHLIEPHFSRIIGNTIFETSERAIFIEQINACNISDNIIGFAGEYLQTKGQGILISGTNPAAPHGIVSNNVISSATGAGIKLVNVKNLLVSNNELYNVSGVTNEKYYGSATLIANYEPSIFVDSQSYDNTIVNNKITAGKYVEQLTFINSDALLANVVSDEQHSQFDEYLISKGIKNKLPNNVTSGTYADVTVTHNEEDDSIGVNGTPSANAFVEVFRSNTNDWGRFEKGKQYKFFINRSIDAQIGMRVDYIDQNDEQIVLASTFYNNKTVTIPTTAKGIVVYMILLRDQTYNNSVAFPMAVDWFVTSNTFAKYTSVV